jgi:type IV pilus assembly protein PilB
LDARFTPRERKSRLGELLVASGAITEQQLEDALSKQKSQPGPIGQVLVKLGYLTDDAMRLALSSQLGVPFVDLDDMVIDRSLGKLLNRGFARRNLIVPIAQMGRTLTVAMDDPTKTSIIDDLARTTGMTITVVTSSNRGIQRALRKVYEAESGPDVDPKEPAAARPATAPPSGYAAQAAQAAAGAGRDDQIGRRADELFQKVLVRAIESRCSDIHLEMLPDRLHLRFRIDGVLRIPDFGSMQQQVFDRSMREIVSRIKILSQLDIAERRRPQDGSFQFLIDRGGKPVSIDLRVSIIPTTEGESVVVRILDKSRAPKGLDELQLEPEMTSRIERVLTRTAGIFLVTGPTGSGKSTTLYACLTRLNRPEIRILTAEDPVEYMYEGISQSEVNAEIGNTFAAFLRAFLRHDPEVIMVGEIRDEETAEIAFRAAQTGHLLLSTLHTNSAVEALPRLMDLDVHPSLIASALLGVMSQRLARQVCPHCRQPDEPSDELVREFFGDVKPDVEFVRGAGCDHCLNIGYSGRALVADLWTPDQHDNLLIMRKAPFEDIRRSAERTTISMAQDSHRRLVAQRTTLEELARVLPYSAILEHRQRAEAGTLR